MTEKQPNFKSFTHEDFNIFNSDTIFLPEMGWWTEHKSSNSFSNVSLSGESIKYE